MQRDVRGRDTGTDGMAGVLAAVDCAATSVGFPIRNMHTISELAHTGDVLGCVEALHGWLEDIVADELSVTDYADGHPRYVQPVFRPSVSCFLAAGSSPCFLI